MDNVDFVQNSTNFFEQNCLILRDKLKKGEYGNVGEELKAKFKIEICDTITMFIGKNVWQINLMRDLGK